MGSALGAAIYAMAKKRNVPDALMFRVPPGDFDNCPPEWIVVASSRVALWRRFGFVLLADERQIRWADIDEVRRLDEDRGRRN